MLFWIIIFVISIAVLIKSADYFTDSAEKIGLFFRLSPFIVGVTIVAIGTSIPELATSLTAVISGGNTEFVIANVVGSNIANILLVVGLTSFLGGSIFVRRNLLSVDLPILVLATALFSVFVIWDGVLSLYEGIMLFLAFIVYLWYALTHKPRNDEDIDIKELKQEVKQEVKKGSLNYKIVITLFLSVTAIYFSSKYTVNSVVELSKILNIGLSRLVVFIVAIGTSLPELVVSIVAIKKQQHAVAVGNVLGSNVFNLLFITSVPSFIQPLNVSKDILYIGLPFLGITTVVYIFSIMDKKVTKYEGVLFLLLYLSFIMTIFSVNL